MVVFTRLGQFCLPVVGLSEVPELVLPRSKEVEQRDHGALELYAAASLHCGGGELLAHDCLAYVVESHVKGSYVVQTCNEELDDHISSSTEDCQAAAR